MFTMAQIDFNVLKASDDSEIRKQVKAKNEEIGGTRLDYMSEPHVACCLLVDTSSSMASNGKINQLNNAIRNFKTTICEDALSSKRVDVCVISFDSKVSIVSPFCPIREFDPPTLSTTGMTCMGAGIRFALETVHEQIRKYHDVGVDCYKPFILMITDGFPTDDIADIDKLIATRESEGRYGHLRFHAFGVEGADMQLLSHLTHRVLAVDDNAFDQIFNWTSETMKIISHSKTSDNVVGADLPEKLFPYDPKTKKVPWAD